MYKFNNIITHVPTACLIEDYQTPQKAPDASIQLPSGFCYEPGSRENEELLKRLGEKAEGKKGKAMRLPTCAEWDQLADVVEEPNTAIHWRNMYSWCQNADPDWASYRAVRGYYSARRWSHYHAARRDMRVGFRPALDTLDFDPYPLTELLSQLEPSI